MRSGEGGFLWSLLFVFELRFEMGLAYNIFVAVFCSIGECFS